MFFATRFKTLDALDFIHVLLFQEWKQNRQTELSLLAACTIEQKHIWKIPVTVSTAIRDDEIRLHCSPSKSQQACGPSSLNFCTILSAGCSNVSLVFHRCSACVFTENFLRAFCLNWSGTASRSALSSRGKAFSLTRDSRQVAC